MGRFNGSAPSHRGLLMRDRGILGETFHFAREARILGASRRSLSLAECCLNLRLDSRKYFRLLLPPVVIGRVPDTYDLNAMLCTSLLKEIACLISKGEDHPRLE